MSGLTWLQLAESDDFLTRNLIDNMLFWIETRKVKKGYQNRLMIGRQSLVRLLKKYIIGKEKPNIDKCMNNFTNLPATKTFLSRYKKDKQVLQEFKKHARKYLELYFPECGFEMMTTDRYELKSGVLETSVVAKKEYNAGDEVRYLTGTFAELKPDEEDVLDKSDFSVMNLTSRANSCLMLGPLRFVNHDCDANARFASSRTGLKIFATKKILVGQEITVTYAKSYFGKDNKDCLCATCERLEKGYYDPKKYVIPADAELIHLSSSEGETVKEEEDEIIMVDTESGTEDKNTNEATPVDDEDLSSMSPIPVDPQEFDKTTKDKEGKKLPSIVSCIRLATDEPFVEPDSEEVGGRRLRPRQMIKMSGEHTVRSDILKHYQKDNSIDSLLIEIPDLNKEVLRQRRINRTLHKLLMTQLYKSKDKSQIYDCRHCGIYFKFFPEAQHQYKEYCPRCARHQIIHGLAWPETKTKADSGYLILNDTIERPPLSKVEQVTPRELKSRTANVKHDGIATDLDPGQYNGTKSHGDTNTPKISPSGSANTGKGGIKKVAGLRKLKVHISELYENEDGDTKGKKGERISHIENHENGRAKSNLPISKATMISKNLGVKQEKGTHHVKDHPRRLRHHTRHMNHHQDTCDHHENCHKAQEVRRNRFEKQGNERSSRDSTPTKEEILASHPKINPTELAYSVNARKGTSSSAKYKEKLSKAQQQQQQQRSKSTETDESAIESISEQKFISAKTDGDAKVKSEPNSKTKSNNRSKNTTIVDEADVVKIASESDDDITPIKPFKPRNLTRKRQNDSIGSEEQQISPLRKLRDTRSKGVHKVNKPSSVKLETLARPRKLKGNSTNGSTTTNGQSSDKQTLLIEISDSDHEARGNEITMSRRTGLAGFYTKA